MVAGSLGSGCNASVGKESDSCLVVISFFMILFVLGFLVAPHSYISLLLTELWPWSLKCGAEARWIATFLSILSLQNAPGLPAKWKQTWAEPGPSKLLTLISGQAGDLKEGHMVILWFISNGIRLQPWGERKSTLKNGAFTGKFSGCHWRFS